jgi:hypothetical protein
LFPDLGSSSLDSSTHTFNIHWTLHSLAFDFRVHCPSFYLFFYSFVSKVLLLLPLVLPSIHSFVIVILVLWHFFPLSSFPDKNSRDFYTEIKHRVICPQKRFWILGFLHSNYTNCS